MKKKLAILICITTIFSVMISSCGGGGGGAADTSSIAPTPTPDPAPSGSISIGWTAPTQNVDDTVCNDLAGYVIYYSTTSPVTKLNSTRVDIGNVNSYVIPGVTAGTYHTAICAYDYAGNESDLSNEKQVIVQ